MPNEKKFPDSRHNSYNSKTQPTSTMSRLILLSFFTASLSSGLNAATVNYDSGSGAGTTVFETTSGTELVGGHMYAGSFAVAPSIGIGMTDIIANFNEFSELDTGGSSNAGYFADSTFTNPVAGFESDKIYLLVIDTSDINTATQYALLSSSLTNWEYPASDVALSPSIGITDVDEFFAGTGGETIDNPGGIPGTFNSIQLAAVPEPSAASLLLLVGSLGLLRRKR